MNRTIYLPAKLGVHCTSLLSEVNTTLLFESNTEILYKYSYRYYSEIVNMVYMLCY